MVTSVNNIFNCWPFYSTRFSLFESFAIRFEKSDNWAKKWKIARFIETRTTIFGLTRCEWIIRRGTRQARGIAAFGEYWNAKCFSKEIKNWQRYNFGDFNSRSRERDMKNAFAHACLRRDVWNLPKSYRISESKIKEREKNINMEQTLNILLIVDHNFTTIFRQPDGSAG